MKLTSLSVIFTLIIGPFLFISAMQSDMVSEDARLRLYYDSIIDNAVQDASLILAKGAAFSYSGGVNLSNSRDLAAQAFFNSLYHAFNVYGNSTSMARVDACVPVLIFLHNEGYYFYALNEFKGTDGHTRISHCWFPMQHYVGDVFKEYSIRYTLGKKVYILDAADPDFYYEGDYDAFEKKDEIDFFSSPEQFETVKLNIIRNSIENDFKAYISHYNQWALKRSISVRLELPAIDDGDWKRAVKDEGILTFAQGFPVLTAKSYRHYALGGARVIRKSQLSGYVYNHQKWYCRKDCVFLNSVVMEDDGFDKRTMEYFSDAIEAAKAGHFPCPECRP